MAKLIAKKYVNGLLKAISKDEINIFLMELGKVKLAFQNVKTYEILTSPDVLKEDKE